MDKALDFELLSRPSRSYREIAGSSPARGVLFLQQQGGRGGVLSLVGSSQSARRSFVPDKTLVLLESVHTDGASSEGRDFESLFGSSG